MSGKDTLTITTRGERDVVITRVFDAPRDLVFEAWTTPELVKRWLVAPGRTLEVCEIDLRVGGAYHFVWQGPGRKDVGMRGTYREIVAPERLVNTEQWQDWDVGEIVSTTVFAERDEQTMMTFVAVYPSRDVRDAVLKSGMESGARAAYDALDELLATRAVQ